MSQAIATPPPDTTPKRVVARLWNDPDGRSVTIGILGVLLIHLLLYLLAPYFVRWQHQPVAVRTSSPSKQFDIEMVPEPEVPQREKPINQKQFVETNPDAPENTPDKTNNFAAQNQQVAQEKPTPDGNSERPATEGKKDFQSNAIVTGRLQQPVERAEPPSPPVVTPAEPSVAQPRAQQNPLPGFEKSEGANPDAYGSAASPARDNIRPIPQPIEGMRDVPIVDGATDRQPAIDPKRPRPRQQLVRTQQVRSAVLAENKFGTRNVGITAINAKFNEYGLYLQRLADAVDLEFHKLVEDGRTYPPAGTYVVVKFILDSEGKIPAIVNVENHSTDVASRTCVSAITNRAPYGPWTDDMKAALNPNGEELIFTFYYE